MTRTATSITERVGRSAFSIVEMLWAMTRTTGSDDGPGHRRLESDLHHTTETDRGVCLNASNRSVSEGLYRWWCQDYAPLDGRLRAVVYGLLLYFAVRGSIFGAPALLRDLPAPLYQPPTFMGWLQAIGLSQPVLIDLLTVLQVPFAVLWALAVIGLGGRWPLRLTGCLALLFYGSQQGCVGTGHGWHLPVATLFVCGWLIRQDQWSVDALVARRWPAWPFNPARWAGAADLSPFARKLVLLLAVYTLFAGGVTKLVQGGWRWMDGVSLNHYLAWHNDPSTAFGNWLLPWLLTHPGVVAALSVSTVVFELGAIAVLFWPRWRWPFFIAANGFHLGIYFVMIPRFFEQMTVYLMLVPWDALANARGLERIKVLFGVHWLPPRTVLTVPKPRVRRGLLLLTSGVIGLLVWTLARQREWFPLTHIPMYSTYLSDQRVGMIPRTEFDSLDGLHRIAHSDNNHDLPWWTRYEIARRLLFQAVTADGQVTLLASPFPGMRLNRLTWAQRISFALLDDLRTISPDEPISTAKLKSVRMAMDATAGRIWDGPAGDQFVEFRLLMTAAEEPPVLLLAVSRTNSLGPPSELGD